MARFLFADELPWGLLGCLLGWGLGASLPAAPSVQILPTQALTLDGPQGLAIESMNVRQWRALPGIGHGRAEALLLRRWQKEETGAVLDWRAVEGIGPKTEARLEAWLSFHAPRESAR